VSSGKAVQEQQPAAGRIRQRIHALGEAPKPEAEPAKPKRKARGGAQAPKGAPTKGKATKKTTAATARPNRLSRATRCQNECPSIWDTATRRS